MNFAQDITVKYNAKKIKFIQNSFSNRIDNCSLLFMLALIGVTEKRYIKMDSDDGTGDEHTFSIRTIYTRYAAEMDSNIGLICILENLGENYDYVINKLAFATTESEKKKYSELYNVELFMGYVLGGVDILYKDITIIGYDEEKIFDGLFDKINYENNDLYNLSKNLINAENDEKIY